MKIRKQIVAGALASSVVGLAACGGGDKGTQDVGSKEPVSTSRAFYARAVDGYLAGATVYVDLNRNNELDAFEPRALTDKDGYFSYNHDTKTDYCATGGLPQYCLSGNIAANEEVIIRVTGGYDTVTKLPFKGVLSLRSSELGRDDMRAVTPVTSMVADTSPTTAEAKFQALLEAGVFDPSSEDPMLGGVGEMSRAQLAALISRVVGDVGKSSYPATFQDVQSDVWSHAYISMAAQLVEGVDFGSFYSSSANLEQLSKLTMYGLLNPAQTMPTSFVPPNWSWALPRIQGVAGIVGLNEEMLAAFNGASATAEERLAILRLQAVAMERLLANPSDPELQDLKTWVRNQLAQNDGLGSDLTALGGSDIDLGKLIGRNFNFDPTSNTISASATIPAQAASTFAALVNTSFGLEIDRPDEQGAALLFVSGAAGATSGDIKVCVRYRGDDEDFDTTTSSDPNGALLIGGHWSLLDNHSLTLSVDVVGGVRSLLINAVGGSGGSRDYRFDFGGGDLSEWSGSAPAAFAAGAVPISDAACRTTLMQTFGAML